MSPTTRWSSARFEAPANAAALVATLALPFVLIHARGVAEGLLAALGGGFVLRCLLRRDWAPFCALWVLAPLAYWAWLVIATIAAGAPTARLLEALAWARMPLAPLAIAAWVLVEPRTRSWLLWSCGLAAGWIALEVWLQLVAGRGILGFRRWPAGELPGPFTRPRAGHFLVRLMWPPLLHAASRLLAGDRWRQAGGFALLAGALATLVFIGQRLPVVFGLFGLAVAMLLLPSLRRAALLAILAGGAALALSALIAPTAFHRLAVQFFDQLAHFPQSHYGRILARALAMARQHPLFGLGADGFRDACADPAYFSGWSPGDDGGGAAICVQHPHNPYLEALVDAGFPGLLLFAAAALAWLWAVGRRLWADPRPLRIGLFLCVLIQLWPVGSSSGFTSLPIAGVFLLMLGWGIAEASADTACHTPIPEHIAN